MRSRHRSTTERRRALVAALLPLGLAVGACGGDSGADGGASDGASDSADPPSSSAPADDATGTTGTPGTAPTDSPAPGTSGPASGSASGSAGQGRAGDVTAAALAAIRTAERRAGGTAYTIDDPGDDDGWEVEVAVGRRSVEVEVSGDGRQVRGTDEDDLDGDDRRALDRARVDLSRAVMITIERHGGVLDEAGLDDDDDRYHWSVNLRNGDEYDVGLANGAVRRADRDGDDD